MSVDTVWLEDDIGEYRPFYAQKSMFMSVWLR